VLLRQNLVIGAVAVLDVRVLGEGFCVAAVASMIASRCASPESTTAPPYGTDPDTYRDLGHDKHREENHMSEIVNVDNFARAETARMFDGILAHSSEHLISAMFLGASPLDPIRCCRWNHDDWPVPHR